jgi:hypothetical protein
MRAGGTYGVAFFDAKRTNCHVARASVGSHRGRRHVGGGRASVEPAREIRNL